MSFKKRYKNRGLKLDETRRNSTKLDEIRRSFGQRFLLKFWESWQGISRNFDSGSHKWQKIAVSVSISGTNPPPPPLPFESKELSGPVGV